MPRTASIPTATTKPGFFNCPESRAVELQKELRCLVCQGQSLDTSDAPLAADLRRFLRVRIAGGETSDRIKQELADAESTRLSIIQKANEQANAIIAEAQRSANIRAERRAREAAAQADDIIRKAHEAAVLDRDRLLAELKRHVGSLVIQTTEKVTGKVLTPDDQARLNSETVREINAANN